MYKNCGKNILKHQNVNNHKLLFFLSLVQGHLVRLVVKNQSASAGGIREGV